MVLRVPYTILLNFILIFAAVGAFTVNNNLFDVWMMVGFGVLGYLMTKLKYPIVPLVLGLVLGRLAENSLRQALTISGGSLSIFFERPICVVFLSLALLGYLTPLIRWGMRRAGRRGVGLNVEPL
jgi:putative tricarboxylic transport membrane protein